MPFAFRISGWALTLVGMGVFIFGGGFGKDSANTAGMVGIFIFLAGMILTSLSGLITTLQYRRGLRNRAKEAARQSAKPSEPSKPE